MFLTWLRRARNGRYVGMTDLEGRNFRLAGLIAERHTKGTGFYRTGLFLSFKKPPDRRQAMEHLRYPNESTEYRAARNALLTMRSHFVPR